MEVKYFAVVFFFKQYRTRVLFSFNYVLDSQIHKVFYNKYARAFSNARSALDIDNCWRVLNYQFMPYGLK